MNHVIVQVRRVAGISARQKPAWRYGLVEFALTAALLVLTTGAWGQDNASITGTVVDSTGAALQNAQISLTNTATGQGRQVTSNSVGAFLFANVGVGQYKLGASAPGFQKYTKTDIVVHKTFVDGPDVVTWYDLHTRVAPPAAVAEWSHVEGGKITMVRVVFDARPFAAAVATVLAGQGRRCNRHRVQFNEVVARDVIPVVWGVRPRILGVEESQHQPARLEQRPDAADYRLDQQFVHEISHIPRQHGVEGVRIIGKIFRQETPVVGCALAFGVQAEETGIASGEQYILGKNSVTQLGKVLNIGGRRGAYIEHTQVVAAGQRTGEFAQAAGPPIRARLNARLTSLLGLDRRTPEQF